MFESSQIQEHTLKAPNLDGNYIKISLSMSGAFSAGQNDSSGN